MNRPEAIRQALATASATPSDSHSLADYPHNLTRSDTDDATTSMHADSCDLCLCEYGCDDDGDPDYPPGWGGIWADCDDSDCDDNPPDTDGDGIPF